MSTSRRDFIASSAASVLAAAIGRPRLAHALPARPAQEPVFTPIRRNTGYFTMYGGTVGWLVNPSAVVVVDSQFPPSAKLCIDGLAARSNKRPVDLLINTHHHPDHTSGNITYRGVAKKVVAHARAAEHMRHPPGGKAPADQLYPDTTFTEAWSADVGDEKVSAKFYGRAHTSGDITITFERANVVHMGDLMFNQMHPAVDRAAGATIRNWATVLDRTVREHANDTIYIFGHANEGRPVTGGQTDVLRFRDYLGALVAFVEKQVKAGKSRQEILAMRGPLAGSESYGRFEEPDAFDPLTAAYEEVTAS